MSSGSVSPTTTPTLQRTSFIPTVIPTFLPSPIIPSYIPSIIPSFISSIIPSAIPSIIPTTRPTIRPTTMPTLFLIPSSINSYYYYGKYYSTLANVDLNGPSVCQTNFNYLPKNWVLAPDDTTSRAVIALNTWSTSTVVLASGYGYYSSSGAQNSPYPKWLSYSYSAAYGYSYSCAQCNCQILIMYSPQITSKPSYKPVAKSKPSSPTKRSKSSKKKSSGDPLYTLIIVPVTIAFLVINIVRYRQRLAATTDAQILPVQVEVKPLNEVNNTTGYYAQPTIDNNNNNNYGMVAQPQQPMLYGSSNMQQQQQQQPYAYNTQPGYIQMQPQQQAANHQPQSYNGYGPVHPQPQGQGYGYGQPHQPQPHQQGQGYGYGQPHHPEPQGYGNSQLQPQYQNQVRRNSFKFYLILFLPPKKELNNYLKYILFIYIIPPSLPLLDNYYCHKHSSFLPAESSTTMGSLSISISRITRL